jgi:hypothetical protein
VALCRFSCHFNRKDFRSKTVVLCGTTIWGYMNVVKPANLQNNALTLSIFKRLMEDHIINTDFYFADFEMNIVEDKRFRVIKVITLTNTTETLYII